MSWRGTSTMDQKRYFVEEYLNRKLSITKLCEDFGISRQTAHKYIIHFCQIVYSKILLKVHHLLQSDCHNLPLKRNFLKACIQHQHSKQSHIGN